MLPSSQWSAWWTHQGRRVTGNHMALTSPMMPWKSQSTHPVPPVNSPTHDPPGRVQFIWTPPPTLPPPRQYKPFTQLIKPFIQQAMKNFSFFFFFLPQLCIFSCSNGSPMLSTAITFGGSLLWGGLVMLWADSSNTSRKRETNAQTLASEQLRAWPLPIFVLTILPSVASPPRQSPLEYLPDFFDPRPHKTSVFYLGDLVWLLKELLFTLE